MNMIDGPGPSSVATVVLGTGREENLAAEDWRIGVSLDDLPTSFLGGSRVEVPETTLFSVPPSGTLSSLCLDDDRFVDDAPPIEAPSLCRLGILVGERAREALFSDCSLKSSTSFSLAGLTLPDPLLEVPSKLSGSLSSLSDSSLALAWLACR